MPRFVVVGAGAIGGLLGARLAIAGEDVVLVARGAHLEAMRQRGLVVRGPAAGAEVTAKPPCTDDLGAVRDAAVVLLGLKAHSLPAVARQLGANLHPDTTVVSLQNGIPWWYFERLGGPLDGLHLDAVDPGGVIAASIDAGQVVGGIAYPAAQVAEPGVIDHVEGERLSIGELDGSRTPRCQALAAAFAGAGFRSRIQRDIRQELWFKLLGNAAFNPISALTRASLVEIAEFPDTRELSKAVMEEVAAVARAVGVELALAPERRLAGAAAVGAHKTSMLQDVEQGRPLEVGAVVGAVVELGARLGLDLPHLATLHACVRLLDPGRPRSTASH
jgi:2-dehydropantoate 2-reductase